MTDGEVLAFLRHTVPGRRCGMFREDQVGRPLLAAARPVTGGRRWAVAAVLLGTTFGLKARAQEATLGANPKPMEPAPGKTTAVSSDSSFLVQGIVRNWWGVRKQGAWVKVGDYGAATDAKGYFGIRIPQSSRGYVRYVKVNLNTDDVHIHPRAKEPFDSARTRLYHIRLKKVVERLPGFY